ncbi:hypothetical protein PVAG01_08350 [Phlyctema vagabunda]|uniref:feruloyl esterase n=1 Tax=Phlyctema vagabunda TaxID=108571 RepID=A0ABR4P964_9HELO
MKIKYSFALFAGLARLTLATTDSYRYCGWPSSLHCQKELPDRQSLGGMYNVSIKSGNQQRSYLVSIPECYYSQLAAPVILSYHGGSRDAEYQRDLDQFTNPDFNQFAIVVYPQGINNAWQGVPGQPSTVDDFEFTADILDELEKLYCIDRSRIWAVGKSDGGGFTNQLACNATLSRRIAAFAAVSGAFYVDTKSCDADTVVLPCSPGRAKIPMLEIHGGDDTTISYQGGERRDQCLPSIPHFIQDWALLNDLPLESAATHLTSDTIMYSFGTGFNLGLLTHIFDGSIGHDWPSTIANADNTQLGHSPASYNATPLIMDFFKNYTVFLV